jgi:hypothetical protein
VNEKITNKKKTYGNRNFAGLTENRNSWNLKKSDFVEKKVNLNSGFGNMHITDNNMEIRSP